MGFLDKFISGDRVNSSVGDIKMDPTNLIPQGDFEKKLTDAMKVPNTISQEAVLLATKKAAETEAASIRLQRLLSAKKAQAQALVKGQQLLAQHQATAMQIAVQQQKVNNRLSRATATYALDTRIEQTRGNTFARELLESGKVFE